MKAVWPDFWGAFLKTGRPRGPGKTFRNVGGEAPHISEGLSGLPGPARPQKRTPTIRPDFAFMYPVEAVSSEGSRSGFLAQGVRTLLDDKRVKRVLAA
jgi:hypothetical protein